MGRLSSPIAEFGFRDGLIYLIDRALRRYSSHSRLLLYEFLEQPITGKALLPPRLAKGIEVRRIDPQDPAADLLPVSAETRAWRFEQGAICLGAFRKESLIGYIWFALEGYKEDEIRCDYEFPDSTDAVFDFGLYLFPEHRMGLGFVALWDGANRYLREIGKVRSFSRLARFNVASGRAHEHLGTTRIGRAVILRLGVMEAMIASLRPYLQVSLRTSQRMRLRMRPSQP